ncbi:MarR family protein [Blastococcus aggregatus]|uniref:MarR family protein n=1 Tax=Blastococcus aggregatus TaxID=38502 RepID=A0A285V198_9ACTN|nr:replication/maintenance protein RepL [Blastococcus aggregatus]SOC47830.1 MarR family protein [Blastococcus aggregatus]
MAKKTSRERGSTTRELRDMHTGEVVLAITPKAQLHYEQFTLVFCHPMQTLLLTQGRRHERDSALRPVHWRLLWWVIASISYENRIDRYVADIARDLGNDRSTVSKALRVLQDRGLIRTHREGPGRPLTILIHPALCFRGKAKQRAAVFREHWGNTPLPPALGGWTPAAQTTAEPEWTAPHGAG